MKAISNACTERSRSKQLTINSVIVISIATTFKSLVGRVHAPILGFSPNLMFLNFLMVYCSFQWLLSLSKYKFSAPHC